MNLLKLKDVSKKVGISQPMLRKMWTTGRFPKPIENFGAGNRIAWKESDIDAWIESL